MKTIAVIQARMGSSRLPGKVLAELAGLPVLYWVVRAARQIPGVDLAVVATSTEAIDDEIADWSRAENVDCFRGVEEDVLSRISDCAKIYGADEVLRLTADCPFLDPQICGVVLTKLRRTSSDYASNVSPPTWPDGLDCEAISVKALLEANAKAELPEDRQHVTPYIRRNAHEFSIVNVSCPIPGLHEERWTLDTLEDLEYLNAIAENLSAERPPSYLETLEVIDKYDGVREKKPKHSRNQGYRDQLAQSELRLDRRFSQSETLYERAIQTIPLGSQTFSKSRIQFPQNEAPLFLSHGHKGRVWDVDGNEYVDLLGALLPVVLGYCDPDVDEAIRRQLDSGISFSLATSLEIKLAELITSVVPCAEMVRFGKNGTDATSAAIRLARAFTGRERIAVCGYHGWQDWYIGATTKNKGVPPAVSGLTHTFTYNDLESLSSLLKTFEGEFAAVIMEPVTMLEPEEGYLAAVKQLTGEAGALLVFDEIITGFRFDLGGAQKIFGVTPDLCTLGKSMANGMPLSAIAGRADVMNEMENIFFSGTFGGETLSLAAAISVIEKMQREPVIESLWQSGQYLKENVGDLISNLGLNDVVEVIGYSPWTQLRFNGVENKSSEALRTFFLARAIQAGVLTLGTQNMSYSHTVEDLNHVLSAYNFALIQMKKYINDDDSCIRLAGPPIQPVFKVR